MPDPVIAIDDVDFAYGHLPVLEGVSLAVAPGEFVALVGPNGSGKSTLLRIMLGLLRPARGTVRVFGDPPGERRHRGRLGFVPQRPGLAGGVSATVDDIVASGRLARTGWRRQRDPGAAAAIESALAAVDLLDLRHRAVAGLSGGQQQRAFIARALATEPEVLVLDEPVAGVDAESQRSFRSSLTELVRERGGSVLLVSHELGAVADDLDRIVVLKGGIRFDGPPADLVGTGVSLGVHPSDLPLWLEDVR